MRDVVTERKDINVAVMDPLARQVLGYEMAGMSSGPYGATIHLTSNDAQKVAIAEAAFAGYWALVVGSTKLSIAADGVDTAIVSCNDPQLAGLTKVNYHVLLDGIEYATGEADLDNGGITLELASNVPGRYVVIIWSSVNYKSGAVIVEATDGD